MRPQSEADGLTCVGSQEEGTLFLTKNDHVLDTVLRMVYNKCVLEAVPSYVRKRTGGFRK